MRTAYLTPFFIALLLLTGGCASSGPAVQTLQEADLDTTQLPQDQQADLEQLREIRERDQGSDLDPEVRSALTASRHYTALEYCRLHPASADGGGERYTVGPKDVLNVYVYQEEDLSRKSIPVTQEGSISLPLLGRLQVDGLTTTQIEDLVAQRLRQGGYLLQPQVTVDVQEYNSQKVLVLGTVRQPGRYSLQASENLLEVLSKAGGVDFEAGGRRATVIRNETLDGEPAKVAIDIELEQVMKGYDQYANLMLRDGDVVVVPEAEKIFVLGQVNKPGEYLIENQSMSIVEAIGMAGGFTRIAAPNRVKLVRMQGQAETIMLIRVEDIMEKGLTDTAIGLQANDVIIVPESYL